MPRNLSAYLIAFAAGFLAVPLFHQIAACLLSLAGIWPGGLYSMKPTQPLGVPTIFSQSFWGGVWALVMLPVLRFSPDKPIPWLKALLFGGLALTLFSATVVRTIKGLPLPPSVPTALTLGFVVNGAWGVGTVLLAKLGHSLTRKTATPA